MSDKHPHQELALKFWADPTQEYRFRNKKEGGDWSKWTAVNRDFDQPTFYRDFEYELRLSAAKRPKRMRYPGGTLTFPAPETEAPALYTTYYVPSAYGTVATHRWENDPVDNLHLHNGRLHLTREAAEEHAAALAELKPVEVEE